MNIDFHLFFYAVNAGAIAVQTPLINSRPLNSDYSYYWVNDDDVKNINKTPGLIEIELSYLFNLITHRKHCDNGILIIGSQHNFSKTIHILKLCNENNMKTIFIFDHWSPFSPHFTDTDNSLVSPSYIFAIDDYLVDNLISIGINQDTIYKIGHIGIEKKVDLINNLSLPQIDKIRKSLNTGNRKIILLALELINAKSIETEFVVLQLVLKALKQTKIENFQLLVRLHPHQSINDFNHYIRTHNLSAEFMLCPDYLEDYEAIAISDLVIGLNSTILLIPLIIGIPTISISLGLIKEINSNAYIIPYIIHHVVQNDKELKDAILKKYNDKTDFKIPFSRNNLPETWHMIEKVLHS